jgi:DNA-binding beta-propeller fold protein YncE
MTTRRELLKLAGFGVVYATFYRGFALAQERVSPVFALRGDGSVVVIDPRKDEVIAKISTGGKGGTLGSITKDGKYLFVANNAPDQRTVSVIDAVNLRKVKDIETGARPKHPIVSPNGRVVAVNHSGIDDGRNRVAFISTRNLEVIKTVELPVLNTGHKGDFSMHGTFSPDGKYYFTGSYSDNRFFIISTSDFSAVAHVDVAGNPHYFDCYKNTLWVTVEFNEPKRETSKPMVYVYDISNPAKPREMMVLEVGLDTDEISNTARIEGHHGNFTNDGKYFMVCNRGASPFEGTTVRVYTNDGKLVKAIKSAVKGVGHAYISPNGEYAVITQYGDTKIEIVSLKNFETIKVIDTGVGRHMGHVVFMEDGSKFYVTNRVADSVFVIDGRKFDIIKRIQTAEGGQAQGQVVRHFYGVFERVVNPYLA